MSHLTNSSVLLQRCTCTVSLGLPHVCCLPEPHLLLRFFPPQKNPHPSTDHRRSGQLNPLFIIRNVTHTTEAHNNKGVPGGYEQLKQILFIELE